MTEWLLDNPLVFGTVMLLCGFVIAWLSERAERRYDRKDDE